MSDSSWHLELLLAKERLSLEQREHREYLARRRQDLEGELRTLHVEIAETVAQLKEVGRERVEFGDLRRLTPISPVWGLDRGIPLDRYYIHSFLDRHRADVRGRVLEVKDSGYTRTFGDDRVTASDVLDIDVTNKLATVNIDLSQADAISSGTYDCFILTQTLGVIFDVAGALRHAVRILKPGGVLLCTVPATGRISYEEGLDGDYWRFTEASVRRLFADHFPIDACEITGHGNVLASAAFLYGLAPDELTKPELDTVDPFFPVVYTIRAVKPQSAERGHLSVVGRELVSSSASRTPVAGAVLAYHRIADRGVDRHNLCVPVEEFRGQMRYLRDAGYRVMPLHDLVHAAPANEFEGRGLALTFDDGYLDSLTNAAPILAECGFPATFFLVGAALDSPYEFWWDALERVFFSGYRVPEVLSLRVSDVVVEGPTSSVADRADTYRHLVEQFYRFDHSGRVDALRAIMEWSRMGPRPPGAPRPMTTDEVAHLATFSGISIGAHSQNHVWLPVLPSEQKRREIAMCKARLEEVAGRDVKSFAYPYGAHDTETEQLVRAAGFEVAVTTTGQAVTANVDPFLVPRLGVRRGGTNDFAGRLSALFSSGAAVSTGRVFGGPMTFEKDAK